MGKNILSLFDGMRVGKIASNRSNLDVDAYYSSEVDKYAILVGDNNHKETIPYKLGDVRFVDATGMDINMLIGGSPCQSFSFAGKMNGMSTKENVEILSLVHYLQLKKEGFEFMGESYLFWEYVRILKECKPDYFLLENVWMDKKWEDLISSVLGVPPIKINSNLVSAQNRRRLYWTNIPGVMQPDDKGIFLWDVIDDIYDDHIGLGIKERLGFDFLSGNNPPFGQNNEWNQPFQRISKKGKVKPGIDKAACLTGSAHSGGNHSDMDILHSKDGTRRYTTIECERLQTLPDGYTEGVSNSQRFKMIGKGWTGDVIAHIFSFLPEDWKLTK